MDREEIERVERRFESSLPRAIEELNAPSRCAGDGECKVKSFGTHPECPRLYVWDETRPLPANRGFYHRFDLEPEEVIRRIDDDADQAGLTRRQIEVAISRAVRMLEKHVDTFQWAKCVVSGPDDESCTQRRLRERHFTIDVHEPGRGPCDNATRVNREIANPGTVELTSGTGNSLTGRVNLCAQAVTVRVAMQRASHPLSAGESEYPWRDPTRDCAILRLATLLMHETRHVCSRTHRFGRCDRIDRTDVVFAWAVMQQEPDRFRGCPQTFHFLDGTTLLENFCALELPPINTGDTEGLA